MENNNKLSVTPLTEDEVKKFNKEIDCILCSPVRNNIKDALDAILITVKSFYRSLPAEAAEQTDGLINATTKVVSAAMRSVDEMDAVDGCYALKGKEFANPMKGYKPYPDRSRYNRGPPSLPSGRGISQPRGM